MIIASTHDPHRNIAQLHKSVDIKSDSFFWEFVRFDSNGNEICKGNIREFKIGIFSNKILLEGKLMSLRKECIICD